MKGSMKSGSTRGLSQEKNKGKALEMTVGQIERQFGKGSIMRLGSPHTTDEGH